MPCQNDTWHQNKRYITISNIQIHIWHCKIMCNCVIVQITWEEMKHVCLLSERIRYCHSVLINYKNPGTGRITVYYYTPIVFVRLSSGVCVLGTLLCPLQRARQSRGCRIRELDLIAPLFFMQTSDWYFCWGRLHNYARDRKPPHAFHHNERTVWFSKCKCMMVSRVASTIQWNFWMYIYLLLILKFWIKMTFFSEFLEQVEIVASNYILQFLT